VLSKGPRVGGLVGGVNCKILSVTAVADSRKPRAVYSLIWFESVASLHLRPLYALSSFATCGLTTTTPRQPPTPLKPKNEQANEKEQ